jgi:hypothetical protein
MAHRTKDLTIETPSAEWAAMEEYRDLPRDLRGGLIRIQSLTKKHLWRAARERDHDYQRRLMALQFDPFYWSAMEHLGGQPFTRQVGLSDDVPAELRPDGAWADDIDGQGRDLRQVIRGTCIESAGLGLVYLLPMWSEVDERPYVHVLSAHDVLDPWEEGGAVRLRMTHPVRTPGRPWEKRNEGQIWVLYDGEPTASGDEQWARWEVFEREDPTNPKSPFRASPTEELSGPFRYQPWIPLYPLYTGNGGCQEALPWVAFPPLYEVAAANRVYMNKRSDLDFGLHVSNIPQRCAAGISEAEVAKIDKTSYKGMWWTKNHQGKFYYLEHSGAAFELSLRDLEGLERRIEVWGLQPMLSEHQGNVTATGRMIDLSRATTTAQAWTLGWEDVWTQVCHALARYVRKPDRFELTFFTAFGPAPHDLERAKIIQQDYLQGDLEPEAYYPEMQKLGVYSESFDVQAAVAAAKKRRDQDMKRLATMPVPGGGRISPKPPEAEDQPDLTLSAA